MAGGRRPKRGFLRRSKSFTRRKARVLENYNESQLEENFIRPVLRILGHYFGVQGKVQGKDRTPDYAFYPDQKGRLLDLNYCFALLSRNREILPIINLSIIDLNLINSPLKISASLP